MSDRTIIEAAISGSSKARNPNAPASLADLSADAIACIAAGAGIVHNHLEDFSLSGRAAAERYGLVWQPVLQRHPDAILIPTLAPGTPGDPLGNYAHIVDAMAKGASLAPIDPGSVNMTGALPDGQPDPARSMAFVNDYATLDRALDAYAAHAVPASISVWDPTFLRATLAYERAGRFAAGSFLKLFFGGRHSYLDGRPGVSFGLPATVAALDVYLAMMQGSRLPWAVALLGDDLVAERDFVAAVIARGGHLRVGLEDYAGQATPANADLVAQAAEIAASLGRPAASIAETRQILGLPARRAADSQE
ncbi:MAG TPA: 3-keto-5-aminohexanoate cleavage protein [Sphingobium sp.]|nr:3-keto-5-aminohexanoate cleavage protein [Sphingobium sp.]